MSCFIGIWWIFHVLGTQNPNGFEFPDLTLFENLIVSFMYGILVLVLIYVSWISTSAMDVISKEMDQLKTQYSDKCCIKFCLRIAKIQIF